MKFRIALYLILISAIVVNFNGGSVNSFSLQNKYSSEWSEDDMYTDNQNKEVTFARKIAPTTEVPYIGQIGGLDTDGNNNIVVFHRANRHWAPDSFIRNEFNKDKYGFIEENTLDVINPKDLRNVLSWGKKRFLMPHGLTLDYEGNIWLTDVGSHEVHKYDLAISTQPKLVLAEFNNEDRFCKPTSVAVCKRTGNVYVADGYCHSRLVVFDHEGKFKYTLEDKENELKIVHSIALLEDLNLVCTVSREEGRIVCFDTENRKKKYEITNPIMRTVYAIEYDPINKVIHAVTGENHGSEAYGLTFDAKQDTFGKLMHTWNSEQIELSDAHDLAISADATKIYVGQLNGEIDEFSYK